MGLAVPAAAAPQIYSQYEAATSPARCDKNDFCSDFTSPSGKPVTVVVKVPVTTSEYHAPPIKPDQTAYEYLNGVLYDKSGQPRTGTTIIIPKAIYNFNFPLNSNCTATTDHQPKYVHWQLPYGATDLVIDGQGSTINFSDFCLGLNLPSVNRVTIRNFTFAWPKLQIGTIGTVVAVGGSGSVGYTYDVKIDPADAAHLPAQISLAAATLWDRVHNHWAQFNINDDVSYGDGVTSIAPITPLKCAETPPQQKRAGCTLKNIPSYGVSFKVGQSILLRHYDFASAISISGNDVTLDAINLQNLIGTGFNYSGGRGLRVTHMTLGRMPGQPISGDGNASIITDGVTGDIVIDHSIFGYQGDDAFDMNTPMARFTPTQTQNTTPMATYVFDREHPNHLQFPVSNGATSGDTIALFDNALAFQRVAMASSVTTPENSPDSNVTLADAVPENLRKTGFIAADITSSAGARYIISDNVFQFNRARALLLQTPFGLVDHNVFEGQTMKEVYMLASLYWGEGLGAQEITLSNNIFDAAAHGPAFYALDLIAEAADFPNAQDEVAGKGSPAPAINQNLLFLNNQFTTDRNAALINVSSARNVVFKGDALTGMTGVEPAGDGLIPGPGLLPVSAHDASDIYFDSSNSITPSWLSASCNQSQLLKLSSPPPGVSAINRIACGVGTTVSDFVVQPR